MKIKYYAFHLLVLVASININAATITVHPDEIKDYNEKTGIGCTLKTEKSKTAKTKIICKSKISNEFAWNAATYRAKTMCETQKFSMYFNIPTTLPTKDGIFTAQMEIKCINKGQ